MNKYDEILGQPKIVRRDIRGATPSAYEKEIYELSQAVGKVLSGNRADVVCSVLVTNIGATLNSIPELEFRKFMAKTLLKGVMETITFETTEQTSEKA